MNISPPHLFMQYFALAGLRLLAPSGLTPPPPPLPYPLPLCYRPTPEPDKYATGPLSLRYTHLCVPPARGIDQAHSHSCDQTPGVLKTKKKQKKIYSLYNNIHRGEEGDEVEKEEEENNSRYNIFLERVSLFIYVSDIEYIYRIS